MKLTNNYNLPEEILEALKNKKYSKGGADYSVTEILNPTQKIILQKRYGHEVSHDASDQIWRLIGQSLHLVLESQKSVGIKELRLSHNVLDRTISGQVDHYNEGVITDYKTTSVWSAIYGDRKTDWERQLNLYSLLFQKNNYPVKKLRVIVFYRDWDKRDIGKNNYPQKQVDIVEIPLWSIEEAEKFLTDKIQILIESEEKQDNELPICSPEDRWETQEKFAIMKGENIKATKLCSSEIEAESWILGIPEKDRKKYSVIHRPAESKRCAEYCEIREYCKQYKGEKNA